jgi:hypothetical protein
MKIHQAELPYNAEGDTSDRMASISWRGSVGEWFYIEHRNRPHECIYAKEDGQFYYGLKELSRVVPVVWNLRSAANRVARKWKGVVKKFPYRLEA